MKDAYGRTECKNCGGWFDFEPTDLSAIHICGPMVVQLRYVVGEMEKALKEARQGYECFMSSSKNCACEAETDFICGYHRDLNQIEDSLSLAREVK